MKLEISNNYISVTREPIDKKYYGNTGESNFLYDLKKILNSIGYDLIKKRMWKDGHLVSDHCQYLRTRKKGAGKADIQIYNGDYALYGANEKFNEGQVTLNLDTNIFN